MLATLYRGADTFSLSRSFLLPNRAGETVLLVSAMLPYLHLKITGREFDGHSFPAPVSPNGNSSLQPWFNPIVLYIN